MILSWTSSHTFCIFFKGKILKNLKAGKMKPSKVLLVSAGMLFPKKRDNIFARRQLFLNYDALTLATILEHASHSPTLIHGNHTSPDDLFEELREQGLLPSIYPILLSIPSFYALEWAQLFCRRIKAVFPDTTIVGGGRWVIGPDPDWIRSKIPQLDLVVSNLAETLIHDVVDPTRWDALQCHTEHQQTASSPPNFALNHRLVQDFQMYQPSIEAARGCGRGCAFCEERNMKLSHLQSPELLIKYLKEIILQYDSNEIHPYLEASLFSPNPKWAEKLACEASNHDLRVEWRCESRVDGVTSDTLAFLAKAGLKVIDVGLETASPQQILRMEKSKNPDRYLRSASDVLRACKANSIDVKVNILLYAGENEATVRETTAWLDDHADCIKGVSVGPVVIFGPPNTQHH
jgi:hypothetical protein